MKVYKKKVYIKKSYIKKIKFLKNKIFYIILIFILSNILIFYSFKINKNLSVCLCVIGRRENLYAKEFIEHYKNLGYNHIFIYDNNYLNETNEKFIDVLEEDVKKGFVSIINFFNFRGKHNNPQYEAYYDCYKKNNRNYDWLSFFDFDEYLEIKKTNSTIQKFLSNKRYKHCQNIKLNWLHFESENQLLYFENKPLKLRFNKPIFDHERNKLIKSTVRGKLTNYWKRWICPHSSKNRYKSCSSSGRIVSNPEPIIFPPEYKYAFIKHYFNKSFEEYCIKIKRGWPDETNQKYFTKKLINDNKNDKDKVKIIKKIFNISNIL